MRIDQQDGTISFSNGTSIGSTTTQDAFRSKPIFADARSQDYGTLPWIHYHFSGGQVDDRELLISICFYDQMLVYLKVSADFYPPGKRDWSHYSLEVETETKHFHDRLLEGILGKSTKSGGFLLHRTPKCQETLNKPLQWKFLWGSVHSGHDSKGGSTSITVSYGNRREEANVAYKRRSQSLGQ